MTVDPAQFIYGNLLEDSSAVLSADYNTDLAGKVKNRDLANYWESVSVGTQSVKVDFGSAKSVAYLVIGAHNLIGVDVYLEHSPDNAVWTNALNWTQSTNLHIKKEITPVSKRYWRLRMVGASNDPRIGEWWLSTTVLSFNRFIPGYDPNDRGQSAVINFTDNTAQTRQRYQFLRSRIEFDRINAAMADLLIEFINQNGLKPFWFAWDGGEVPIFSYVHDNNLKQTIAGRGRVNARLEVVECVNAGSVIDDSEEINKKVNKPVFACKLELINSPIYGRATGGSADTLEDSTIDFIDRDVMVSDIAYNEITGTSIDILSIGTTALKMSDSSSPFIDGDKYVIRPKTWDDANTVNLWLTQRQLWPGCIPLIEKISSFDTKIDIEQGKAIRGGITLDVLEWQENKYFKKLISRKNFDTAKLHLYSGYDTGSGVTAADLDFISSFTGNKVNGLDTLKLKFDSFNARFLKPLHKKISMMRLFYTGPTTDQVYITIDGEFFNIWKNDDSTPIIDYDLSDSDYDTMIKVRNALNDETDIDMSLLLSNNDTNSNQLNDLNRVQIDNSDGLTLNGLQITYSGAPGAVLKAVLLAIGLSLSEIDMFDIEKQFFWVSDWTLQHRPGLDKLGFEVLNELLKSCGGWLRSGKKRDITGAHTGSDNNAKLIDTNADFVNWGSAIGDNVFNITDGSSATITNIDSAVSISLSGLSGGVDNDFDTTDSYKITANREASSCRILAPIIPGEIAAEITQDHIIEGSLRVKHEINAFRGRAEIKYNYDANNQKYNDTIIIEDPEQIYFAEVQAGDDSYKTIKLEAPWIKGAGAFINANALADRWLYWRRRIKFSAAMEVILNRNIIQPGDIIKISHPELPQVDGAGLAEHRCLVTRKKLSPGISDIKITIEVIDANFGGRIPLIIAPDNTADWTAASAEVKEKYGFISSDQGLMSDGSEGKVYY